MHMSDLRVIDQVDQMKEGVTRSTSSGHCRLQVATSGSGYASIIYTGVALEYSVSLHNVKGLHSVEIHIGEPNSHGDVVAVLYAAAFPNATSFSNGTVCAGSLEHTGLLGPLLLPLGNHLEVSDLYER